MRLFIVAPFGSSYVRDPGWVSPSAKLSVHIRMAPTIDRDHSLRDYCWAAAAAALRRAHAALLASDRADPDLSLLPGFRPPTFSAQTFSPASFLAASAALTRSDLRVLSPVSSDKRTTPRALFTLDTLPYLGIRLLSFPEIAYLKASCSTGGRNCARRCSACSNQARTRRAGRRRRQQPAEHDRVPRLRPGPARRPAGG